VIFEETASLFRRMEVVTLVAIHACPHEVVFANLPVFVVLHEVVYNIGVIFNSSIIIVQKVLDSSLNRPRVSILESRQSNLPFNHVRLNNVV
jgi:hypothetical protein